MTTGERIRTVRLAKGLTQKEVTDRCGMPGSSIRKYESGQFIPKPETFRRLANAMNASVSDFFDFSQDEVKSILNYEKILADATEKLSATSKKDVSTEYISSLKTMISAAEETIDNYILSAKLQLIAEKAQKEADKAQNSKVLNIITETTSTTSENTPQPKNNDKNVEVLLSLYYELNKKGQQIAIERLQELTQIQAYISTKS